MAARSSTTRDVHALLPLVVLLLTAVLLTLVNPVGYHGGGADDWYYLQAARCVVETKGLCLPHTHWAARFPLILPMAAAISLIGETRLALTLVSLFFGLLSLALFWVAMKRQFGETTATIAGFAMLATPAFAILLTAVCVDTVELSAMLGALICIQSAVRSQNRAWSVLAGALLGIAVISRATSLVLIPAAGLALLVSTACRRHTLPFIAAAAGVLACEAMAYFWTTGSLFYGWHLALGHAHLSSAAIATPLAANESPLFNRHLIEGWKLSSGIHVHWMVDGLINLLLDSNINITLVGALGLLAVERQRAGKAAWLLALGAGYYFCALTYALAIDPQPRMFMPVVAAASAIIGLLLAPLWRGRSRWFVGLFLATMLIESAVINRDSYELQSADPVIAAWSTEELGHTATDFSTHTAMTLIPTLRALPVYDAGQGDVSGRNRLLIISAARCSDVLPGWTIARRHAVARADPWAIEFLRRRHFLFRQHGQSAVCLFNRVSAANAADPVPSRQNTR
ncbi:MAG: hypothetical protein JWO15_849 [Sphingomonadales bacterium]|nr:hypothetical protein [Sphingomonadales bacterium]